MDRGSNRGPGRSKANFNATKPAGDDKPTRTLFIRNISYDTSERSVVDLFSKYGEINRVFNLIPKRGMAFVTYVRNMWKHEAAHSLMLSL
jgi:RNA recognition motif-containing protein